MQAGAKLKVKGMVQGVGFRYFCYKRALQHGINGYAKNLTDNDVELVIEGEENMISEFIEDVKTGPPNANVLSVDIEMLPFSGKFTDFKIY